jgi:hypothetical protein
MAEMVFQLRVAAGTANCFATTAFGLVRRSPAKVEARFAKLATFHVGGYTIARPCLHPHSPDTWHYYVSTCVDSPGGATRE